MLSRRWRDEFNAGRAAVRMAAARGRETPGPVPAHAPEPEIRRDHAGAAPAGHGDTGEVENLRALLAEVHELAELSQARIAELETELTAMHWRADRMADVLQIQGVRKMLHKVTHPDTHPGADEEQRRALTEASSKINAAYDLIDRTKDRKA